MVIAAKEFDVDYSGQSGKPGCRRITAFRCQSPASKCGNHIFGAFHNTKFSVSDIQPHYFANFTVTRNGGSVQL